MAAAISIAYGFAKINGAQFTVLESELTRPLRDVSGFWLTWYYFGYSAAYGTLLALIQILGGVLLIVPRTSLLGALLLLPVAANIVLIDVFYGVDLGGTVMAGVLLACVTVTIAPHAARLRAAILPPGQPARPTKGSLLALGLIVAGSFAATWWVANYNNRAPTPIDGVWSVAEPASGSPATKRWDTVFFERNRARLVVLRAADGTDERRHFEIDANGTVRVWETWLRKGALLMEGQHGPNGRIELQLAPALGGGRIVLQRRSEPH